MLIDFFVGLFGVLFFLFIFWKRLNEDYSSNIIFQVGITILIGLSLGLTVSKIFVPVAFFWTGLIGSGLGMFLMMMKFKLRFYETLEALILAGMPILALMFLKDSIFSSSLYSFLAFVGSLVLIFIAYWLDLNYKNFTWYKSGKIGFAGISIAIIFFLMRSVIAILRLNMISFVGRIEVFISGLAAIIFTGLLINLARKKE